MEQISSGQADDQMDMIISTDNSKIRCFEVLYYFQAAAIVTMNTSKWNLVELMMQVTQRHCSLHES